LQSNATFDPEFLDLLRKQPPLRPLVALLKLTKNKFPGSFGPYTGEVEDV